MVFTWSLHYAIRTNRIMFSKVHSQLGVGGLLTLFIIFYLFKEMFNNILSAKTQVVLLFVLIALVIGVVTGY